MRDWESDVALYLLAGFLALALVLVGGNRLNILQSLKTLLSALT